MGSIHSSTHLGINRKLLKRPDSFSAFLTKLFDKANVESRFVWVGLGIVLGLGVLGSLYVNRRDVQSAIARDALFLAEKTLSVELKTLNDLENPAPPVQKKEVSKATKEKTSESPRSVPAKILFREMNVDAQFPEAVKKFKGLDQDYSGTRAAFEARMRLGGLYFDHAQYPEALKWYEKASHSAQGHFDQAVALSAVGYSLDSMGKSADALATFQKALKLGEESLKGDLLLAIARSYEALHDSTNARSTYDKILSELPNSEFAHSAEILKK